MALRQAGDPVVLLWRRAGTLGLFVVLIFSLFAVWSVWSKKNESAQLRAEAQARLSVLKQREAKLTADIDALKTNRGREAELRKEYDVGAPGEHLVVIMDSGPATTVHATTTMERIASWFSFW